MCGNGRNPRRTRPVPTHDSRWCRSTVAPTHVRVGAASPLITQNGPSATSSVPLCQAFCTSASTPTTILELTCQLYPACPPTRPPLMLPIPEKGGKPTRVKSVSDFPQLQPPLMPT